MHYVEDGPKDWLGWCASNHETIKVGQLDELVGVGLGDGSPVDDPYDFSLLGPNVLSDPPPDKLSALLRLIRTGDRARAQRPERLVDQHDVLPIRNVRLLQRRQLLGEHGLVALALAVLLGLPQAVKNAQVAVFGLEDFLFDDLLSLSVHSSPLRVSDHHVMHLIVFDVVSGDLPSVCTLIVRAAILCPNHDSWIDDSLDKGQVQEARQDHEIYVE